MTSISRCAKPLDYYASNPAINALVREFGSNLDDLEVQDGYLMAMSLLDYLENRRPNDYPIDFAISYQDGDGVLPDEAIDHLKSIAATSSRREMVMLAIGILYQVADGERNQ